jgi:hypothetical protein
MFAIVRRVLERLLLPLLLVLLCSPPALAQYAAAPTAYTVVQVFYPPAGPSVTMTTSRSGPVALVEHQGSAHGWNYFDLATHTNYGWDAAALQCTANAFAGDWGDPFATADIAGELASMHARDSGTDIVNGIHTKVFEADAPQGGGKFRVWLDAVFGEEIKAVSIDASKKVTPMMEVKSLTLGKPPANPTLLPACAKTAIQPLPQPQPTEAQRIAARTGSAPGTYVSGVEGPGSTQTCTVQVSVVLAKTMAIVNGGYRLAIDPTVDPDHPIAYSQPGNPFATGGGVREITSLMQNGVTKLPNPGPAFHVQISHDQANAQYTVGTMLYRQCFGRSTAKLFFVVDSTASFEGGEWVWAK